MKPVVRDAVLGLTAILGIGGLAFMLMAFGELTFKRRVQYPLQLNLPSAVGLAADTPVMLNGVRIGKVTSLRVAENPSDGAVVMLAIDEGTRVPREVRISMDRGLLGAGALSLSAVSEPPGGFTFLSPGDQFEGKASDLLSDLGPMISERLGALDRAEQSFAELSDAYVRVSERLNEVLAPRTLEEVEAGAPANLVSTLARIDRAARHADAWLGDEGLQADVRTAVADVTKAVSGAAEAIDSWTRTANAVRTSAERVTSGVDQASQDLSTLARRLDATIAQVQEIVGDVNAGKGTVGQLVRNPDLYNALQDASRRLDAALIEAQLLLEKYRKEGIPIQF